jgi:hypothetical protein
VGFNLRDFCYVVLLRSEDMRQTHSPGAPRAKSASPFRQDEYQGCLGRYIPVFLESDFNGNKQELVLVVGVG